jgi:hypothetical protein
MRIAAAISVFVLGTLFGTLGSGLLGALLLHATRDGSGAPGDGFLILFFLAGGFVVSSVVSLILASRVWRSKTPRPGALQDPSVF